MDRIGSYDTLATIQKKVSTIDPTYGNENVEWVTHAQVWVEIRDFLPSRSYAEATAQNLETARHQVRIRMHYRNDISSDMRILIHRTPDTLYNIVGGPAMLGRRAAVEVVGEKFSS